MNEKRCIAVVVGFAAVIGGLMIYGRQPPSIPAPIAAPVAAPVAAPQPNTPLVYAAPNTPLVYAAPNTPLVRVEPNTPIIYVEVKSGETKEATNPSDEGNFERLDRIIERSDAVLNQ